jgi:hypothetical protein
MRLRIPTDGEERMPTPSERDEARRYIRRWFSRACQETLDLERRLGLAPNALMAVATALAYSRLSRRVPVAYPIIAAVAAFLLAGILLLVWQLIVTPARLAYEASGYDRKHDEHGIQIFQGGNVPLVRFVTRGQLNRLVATPPRPRLLRFHTPAQSTVSPDDLPAEVRISRRGRILVKSFDRAGILIDEIRTGRRLVEIEVYQEHADS